MFEANPDMKNYFEKFKDMDNEKLFKSVALQDHANVTMEMIDTLVTELDNADATHAKIKKLGADHKKRGIKEDHIKVYQQKQLINYFYKLGFLIKKLSFDTRKCEIHSWKQSSKR